MKARNHDYGQAFTASGCLLIVALMMLFPLASKGRCAIELWNMWYTRYDNAMQEEGGDDHGRVVATDADGNVYVAGQIETAPYEDTYYENVIVKYDSAGSEQWVYRHGDALPARSYHFKDMVVDDEGYIYVAGPGNVIKEGFFDFPCDFLVLKLDPQGSLQWSYLHGDPTYREYPYELGLDASGNVYVTGEDDGMYGYLTIKLDPEGNLLWETHSPGGHDEPSMAVDENGSVYIAGNGGGVGPFTGTDFITLKYDTDGNLLWEAKYDGHEDEDEARAIGVDAMGNVYVTGKSVYRLGDGLGCWEMVTLKYDTEGTLLWTSIHSDYPDAGGNWPTHMGLDSAGNVVVTGLGRLTGESKRKYVTIKYDSEGTELWQAGFDWDPLDVAEYNAEDPILALDANDNVILTGSRWHIKDDITYQRNVLFKYDAAGNELWVEDPLALIPGGLYSWPNRHPIAVDPSGYILIAGDKGMGGHLDLGAVRYSPGGSLQWVANYGSGVPGDDLISDMAQDANGNIIVTGTGGTIALDPEGQILWERPENTGQVEFDENRNIYLVAAYGELLKLDPDGQLLWSRADTAGTIELSSEGYVFAAIIKTGEDEELLQTTKLDLDGNVQWADLYEGPLPDLGLGDIALGAEGSAYVTASSLGDGTSLDIVTLKYAPEGSREWAVRYDGPAMGDDIAYAVEIDSAGNVLVLGSSVGVGTKKDYVTIKYDSGGNLLWVNRYNYPMMNENDYPRVLAIDGYDCVYVTGTSQNGYLPMTDLVFPQAIVTIKYDPDGNELWKRAYMGHIPTFSFVMVMDMLLDDEGNVYLIGTDAWDPFFGWILHTYPVDPLYALILKYSTTGEQIYAHEFQSIGQSFKGPYFGRHLLRDSDGHLIAGVSSDAWGTNDDYLVVKKREQTVPDPYWTVGSTMASGGTSPPPGSSAGIGFITSLLVPLLAMLGLKAAGRRKRARGSVG